jgi:hypothetical protein
VCDLQAVFPVEDYGVRVSTGSGWEYSHLLCYGFTDGSDPDSRPPVSFFDLCPDLHDLGYNDTEKSPNGQD